MKEYNISFTARELDEIYVAVCKSRLSDIMKRLENISGWNPVWTAIKDSKEMP